MIRLVRNATLRQPHGIHYVSMITNHLLLILSVILVLSGVLFQATRTPVGKWICTCLECLTNGEVFAIHFFSAVTRRVVIIMTWVENPSVMVGNCGGLAFVNKSTFEVFSRHRRSLPTSVQFHLHLASPIIHFANHNGMTSGRWIQLTSSGCDRRTRIRRVNIPCCGTTTRIRHYHRLVSWNTSEWTWGRRFDSLLIYLVL